jgi:hypothetical protein
MVVPFQGLSGGEGGQLLADGLTNGLIADLMRFDALQVFAAAPGEGGAPLPAPAAVGARLTSTQTKRAHLAGLPRGQCQPHSLRSPRPDIIRPRVRQCSSKDYSSAMGPLMVRPRAAWTAGSRFVGPPGAFRRDPQA